VLAFPEPFVIFLGFGDSSLNFQLYCYIGNVNYRFITLSEVNFAIDRKFREHGIEIPFPQRVVHMAPGGEPAGRVVPVSPEEAAAEGPQQPQDEGGPAGEAGDA
jgi:small-conductance mechanosensitive channel